ncbi:adipocyte plasma membrane-associated protein Hemomucin-like [Gadus macrocephalus]|uniref:adipocyte plasma membrane-associated protein Hemomucin-like n=1 Tax=Gadus macrocephalus TaxID=80720 RepID=UPI0028CB7142|nr:adipocyte plasma membrane-associated protein Hemomucin-like [Gadus macrocephalus]
MALENSVFHSRPGSLSLPLDGERGRVGEGPDPLDSKGESSVLLPAAAAATTTTTTTSSITTSSSTTSTTAAPVPGVLNPSQELGPVVTTETDPSPVEAGVEAEDGPPLAKVKRSFQSKLAERELNANTQQPKKIRVVEKERGRFGWADNAVNVCMNG